VGYTHRETYRQQADFVSFPLVFQSKEIKFNKKFWEELAAYFSGIRHGRRENEEIMGDERTQTTR
jgi:hypothetical protein